MLMMDKTSEIETGQLVTLFSAAWIWVLSIQ